MSLADGVGRPRAESGPRAGQGRARDDRRYPPLDTVVRPQGRQRHRVAIMTSRHRRALIGRRIHESILDLIAVLNLPQRDETLIAETGVELDRALLQVLVAIRRFGPIGVVELAERGGRDHTTVSRQVAKLAELGLVERRPSAIDRRVKEAVLTEAGRRVTEALDAARERMFLPALTEWSDRDLLELDRLLRRLADDLTTATTLAGHKED